MIILENKAGHLITKITFFVLFIFSAPGFAATTPCDQEWNFQGLEGLDVFVTIYGNQAERKDNISLISQVEDDVEKQLQQAGIHVITSKELSEPSTKYALLIINIISKKTTAGQYALFYYLDLSQNIKRFENMNCYMLNSIWHKDLNEILLIDPSVFRKTVRDKIAAQIKEFIKVHRLFNSKK